MNIEGAMVVTVGGENPNPFFHTVAVGRPQIAQPIALPPFRSCSTHTVDFATSAAETYTITPAR